MYSEIISRIKTEEERTGLVDEIKVLKENLYREGEFFENALKTKVRYWTSQIIRGALAEKEVDKERYLQGLIEELSKLKTVRLVVAFEPTEGAIEIFHSLVNREGEENRVLDFVYAPGILGGAIIIFEGRYRDFSLRRVFDEELTKEREEIFKKFLTGA